jgi:hypothetical protein
MTSAIVTTGIDATFPTPGRDNDSQGFRTNFTAIKTNLGVARQEITALQQQVTQVNTFTNTTAATSTNTGALQVVGGVGIGGDLYVGGSIHGNGIAIPAGGIIMWSGSISTVPSGWGLCDGTLYNNGTLQSPDLRNKFIIGASADRGGVANTDVETPNVTFTQTGGYKDSVVVSHTHNITDDGHTHNYDKGTSGGSGGPGTGAGGSNAVATTKATTGISIDTAGQTGVNQNLPPYFALAYIIKL